MIARQRLLLTMLMIKPQDQFSSLRDLCVAKTPDASVHGVVIQNCYAYGSCIVCQNEPEKNNGLLGEIRPASTQFKEVPMT